MPFNNPYKRHKQLYFLNFTFIRKTENEINQLFDDILIIWPAPVFMLMLVNKISILVYGKLTNVYRYNFIFELIMY